MAATLSPASDKHRQNALCLAERLQRCWSVDVEWDLYPPIIKEGCAQVGRAISMPAAAVLYGLLVVVSFSMSHSVVEVEGTDWLEPVLLWVSICMPTGSGKTSLCKFLKQLVDDTHANVGSDSSSWFIDDQSMEKMGALMNENNSKLLGLYDELAMFLSQMNVFRGKGVTDSHEVALFLQLYGGNSWTRKTVSGEANFVMKKTGLTLGGFIQPNIAKNLLELPSNVEKGFCQRFLWFVPKPTPVPFDNLEKVNKDFSASIVGLMSALWKENVGVKVWQLVRPCDSFRMIYDKIQDQLQSIACMDTLLSGMLSKSKGQILRVAATLHVLFHIESPMDIPAVISVKAVDAAKNLIDVCIQHAAYLAGRKELDVEMQQMSQERLQPKDNSEAHRNATMCLLLPGAVLHLSALLALRKFRDRGNKAGAVRGFQLLEEHNLGQVISTNLHRGSTTMYQFKKAEVPGNTEEKTAFAEKLLQFGVSLLQYEKAFAMEEITMAGLETRKRCPSDLPPPPPPRRSPRKNLFSDPKEN